MFMIMFVFIVVVVMFVLCLYVCMVYFVCEKVWMLCNLILFEVFRINIVLVICYFLFEVLLS